MTALDAAILRSVEQCPTDELRRRALGSVLLVGHGLSFPGSASYLKQRLALQIPGTSLGLDGASVDVITDAKDSGSGLATYSKKIFCSYFVKKFIDLPGGYTYCFFNNFLLSDP